jgi:hypothetical protein
LGNIPAGARAVNPKYLVVQKKTPTDCSMGASGPKRLLGPGSHPVNRIRREPYCDHPLSRGDLRHGWSNAFACWDSNPAFPLLSVGNYNESPTARANGNYPGDSVARSPGRPLCVYAAMRSERTSLSLTVKSAVALRAPIGPRPNSLRAVDPSSPPSTPV